MPEVTEEMRRAVYEADCGLSGHIPDTSNAFRGAPDAQNLGGLLPPDVRGPDADTLPHIVCRRCGKVWLVIEESGHGYDDAEAKLQGKLKATDDLSKRITRIGKNRKEKRAARKKAAEDAAKAAEDALPS